ncbi:MAG: Uma2 family endonuclease [Roseofilum sp. SBFL]|uniref:Uma2 family endonuclease n=1 Tax=unclassified Roseofilum TaxID=2620099 RepID=UPI001B03027A|nr:MULTISPECIES: Uma2 family endonuclease [unclassified Roseofilum]MBP0012617.1 Uma2 family endonuclease [Roseofilum sp. SID3]MBP0025206.1 Uma2 family endonuclease [Roseofilum sp. SID2]MBP0039820.1 Uma2 family endonuclease [Roseofilum sp. SID1]MBP0044393.1 Uma2 family endonuclease [Roseofilum sp. SBFL]
MTSLICNPPTNELPLQLWQPSSWENYEAWRDRNCPEKIKLYYYQHQLLVEMGSEGINHSSIGDLFTMLFAFWFSQKQNQNLSSFGGCLLEKTNQSSAAPDLVLYIGDNYPTWNPREKRYIDLDRWRVPDLVGEISDTTLSSDLDEKKHLYASLGIPEYWVIDVKGQRVFAFKLQDDNQYKECDDSQGLSGLPISLLEQTLVRLQEASNITVANWFSEQIKSLDLGKPE